MADLSQKGTQGDDVKEEQIEFYYNLESRRLATFKDWPFENDCVCTPQKMASAGFYHIPTQQEPDLVKCFMCFKELDGWEPSDDPWKEHTSHSKSCPFLSTEGSTADDLTLAEFLKLEAQRQTSRLMKVVEKKLAEFEQYAQETRQQLERMV